MDLNPISVVLNPDCAMDLGAFTILSAWLCSTSSSRCRGLSIIVFKATYINPLKLGWKPLLEAGDKAGNQLEGPARPEDYLGL